MLWHSLLQLQNLATLDRATEKAKSERKFLMNGLKDLESEVLRLRREEYELLSRRDFRDECVVKGLMDTESVNDEGSAHGDEGKVLDFQEQL
ncbi:hypothetical protein EVAR_67388_1 [Eumeta japonica]|uniref:Uncharacterized protein n=1 Tax=Eumeta variegata TaxID=151549 RepID=A0A4C1ZK88_EUMVA|nr:hypothetical protein EVAR_67388_1 [Eumeta japonica]